MALKLRTQKMISTRTMRYAKDKHKNLNNKKGGIRERISKIRKVIKITTRIAKQKNARVARKSPRLDVGR